MEQGSGAWHQARLGKLTASRMSAAMATLKNGQPGQERKNLMLELCAERMTNIIVPHHVNDAMRHGIDQEPQAKAEYEITTGTMLKPCSFYDHPSIDNFGASPDALIDDDGLAEFKCPTTQTHIRWITSGVVPDEHKPQMAVQILCTGRKWCDFVSYDPRVPSKVRLFVRRYQPETEYLAMVESHAERFLEELDALFTRTVESTGVEKE